MDEDNKVSLSPERIALFEKEISVKRKNKKNNFIFRTGFFLIILISTCLIPFLPTFSCQNLVLSGNFLLTDSEILNYAGYNKNTPLIFVDDKKLEDELNNKEYIISAKVKWSITGLEINIDELALLLSDDNGDILSNGEYYSDYIKSHQELVNYNFKKYKNSERNIPKIIGKFSFLNNSNDEVKANNRKLKVLNNLKKVSPTVLNMVNYFEVVYSSDDILLFAFYFKSKENDKDKVDYYRILIKDETFEFFLKEDRINAIISQIADKEFSNKKVYKHDTINELSYYNTICGYNGTSNVCHTNVE